MIHTRYASTTTQAGEGRRALAILLIHFARSFSFRTGRLLPGLLFRWLSTPKPCAREPGSPPASKSQRSCVGLKCRSPEQSWSLFIL